MTWTDALWVASRDAAMVGLGYVYWRLVRDYMADALAGGEAWSRILLKFVAAAAFVGGLGYASAAGIRCDPGEDCYFQAFAGQDPEGAFRRWTILALIVGGFGLAGGHRWFNDPLNPRGRYADAGPRGRR